MVDWRTADTAHGTTSSPKDLTTEQRTFPGTRLIINKFLTQKLSYSPSGSLYNFPKSEYCQ